VKRLVILGLAALLVLGMGVFALGANASLTIGADCKITQAPADILFNGDITDADSIADEEKCVTVSGNANADVTITATIDGPLTSGGYTLDTSFRLDAETVVDPVLAAGATITHVIPWTDGTWSVEVCVDVHRKGYADHAGTYTAIVTVTCACI